MTYADDSECSAGITSFIKISKLPGLSTEEPTDSVQVVIFGAAESAITIIAASIPILRALVREVTGVANSPGAGGPLPQFYRPYDEPPPTPLPPSAIRLSKNARASPAVGLNTAIPAARRLSLVTVTPIDEKRRMSMDSFGFESFMADQKLPIPEDKPAARKP
jgi:hypothetical protein